MTEPTHVALPIAHYNALVAWLSRLTLPDAPVMASVLNGHPMVTINAPEAPAEASVDAPAPAPASTKAPARK